MAVTCEDWRLVAPGVVAPLLAREAEAWRRELSWDVAESWRVIEPARAAGRLPGFVAREAGGRIAGWTWFLEHASSLQVAVLVADRAEVTRALVEAVFTSALAGRTSPHVVCVRDAAPALEAALAEHGVDVTRYHYLESRLAVERPAAGIGRAWADADAGPVSALFARSYADAAEVRAFAPRGTRAEWQEYTASLVGSSGCGRFLPEASLVVDGPSGRPVAATVVSTIDRGVAHLAQVVVDPGARGRGLGERLVADASAAAVAAGCHTMTLLVAAGNRRARALYDRLGFVERAAFVVGLSAQPRRLSSVALATGGASTRR